MTNLYPIKGSVKCDFTNIAELLRKLPDEFIKKDVATVQRKQWERVAEAARKTAPVDTGRLREMIVTKSGFDKKTGTVFATVGFRKIRAKERRRIRQQNHRRYLGETVKGQRLEYDAYYVVMVEFGAPANNQPPRPFFRKAFDENFQEVLNDYGAELEKKLTWRLEKLSRAPKKRI